MTTTVKQTLAIDPGPEKSGFVVYRYSEADPVNGTIERYGHVPNEEILDMLMDIFGFGNYPDGRRDDVVVEMVGHYGTGMSVGKDVFWTCVWIGRFVQARYIHSPDVPISFCTTSMCRMALCGTAKAKKSNVSQAIKDLIGDKGTKKNPGKTFGMNDHTWSALAVALTHALGESKKKVYP